MAVADLISAWLLPFIAPIALYFARDWAIRKGWLKADNPLNDTGHRTLVAIEAVTSALNRIDRNISGFREESADSHNGIKECLERLKELGEARERHGGMLIYQRIPTPHVPRAAVSPDG